jgi:N-dimethylarginine dimethylaminohydrolase
LTVTATAPDSLDRLATRRRYLMCEPRYFSVDYSINPWMDPSGPTDRGRALAQWRELVATYRRLGHQVDFIEPVPGLPDMVFAANGATVFDGRVLGARFRFAERMGEGGAYLQWFRDAGFDVAHEPTFINEGEGDMLVAGDRLLAGTGFRTDPAAHEEAAQVLGLPVVTLHLVNPRYYHLDTALAVLGEDEIAYYPAAFSRESQGVLRDLYPDAVIADAGDAAVFGLNAVSDGLHVVLPELATGLNNKLRDRGFVTVPVDVTELNKAGGGPKCCTLEIRA